MWRRLRDADAAVAAASSAAKGRGGRGGRTMNKRRAQDQPDGQPTPKKSSRLAADDNGYLDPDPIGPAPAKGLLASAAEAEAHPDGVEEESVPASPEPPNLNGTSGGAHSKDQSTLSAREKSPALPKNIGDPDEHGFRMYNQRASLRDKGINSRLYAPNVFQFSDWEIGFRDTSNDSTKGHTRAKRGKYLDKPNSNGMHFDHWCNGYDFGSTEPEDFDQDLVEQHNVHPKFGIFMPTSKNDQEEPEPCVMPGKPVVFIANPSGRISYASRSFIPTVNHRRAEEAPLRHKFSSSMRRFCKMAGIDSEEVSVAEYLPTEQELKRKSLRTAAKEMKSRPRIKDAESEDEKDDTIVEAEEITDDAAAMSALSVLTYASAFVEAEDVTKTPKLPKPIVKIAKYDAIRDIFIDTVVKMPENNTPPPEARSLQLNVLAELCNVEARLPGHAGGFAYPDTRATVKKEEAYPSNFNHISTGQRHDAPPPFANRDARDRAYPQPPISSSTHDISPYPPAPSYARGLAAPAPEYKPPPPGPSMPEHSYPAYGHSGYAPPPDPRDPRPVDTYMPRRMSGYGNEPPPPPPPPASYPRNYWPQPAPSAPPPPPHSSQHYPPPPPMSHGRMSYSQPGNSDPLPPLRPSRARNSLPEEAMHDQSMRPSNAHGGGIYYPPGPSRSYHRGYPAPDPMGPMHPSERGLSNPSHGGSGQGYMGSPPPPPPALPPPPHGYAPQVMSPTFASQGLVGQSPPGTPQGPGSANRHRSTPSGSSDAGGKYRKLQPAPVPAHRSWTNKPELKTIPYDHKDNGSGAALPSSGPTQIRGWNVNQPRKRSKMERERAESANEDPR